MPRPRRPWRPPAGRRRPASTSSPPRTTSAAHRPSSCWPPRQPSRPGCGCGPTSSTIGFWNAGLLARDVATLDVLSGGRVEVGLGAGHKPLEHEAVGPPFPPFRRARRGLASHSSPSCAGTSTTREFRPAPVQRPVPLLRRRDVRPAASRSRPTVGDIVALGGALQLRRVRRRARSRVASATADERVAGSSATLRALVACRPPTFDALLQQVVRRPARPRDVAGAWEAASREGAIKAADIVDSPFLLVGADAGRGRRGAAAPRASGGGSRRGARTRRPGPRSPR